MQITARRYPVGPLPAAADKTGCQYCNDTGIETITIMSDEYQLECEHCDYWERTKNVFIAKIVGHKIKKDAHDSDL